MEQRLIERRVSACVTRYSHLQQALIIEPKLKQLLILAATQESPEDRWERYEELKSAGKTLVGWKAEHPMLRTTQAYEALLEALDELLPQVPIQEEIDDHSA